MKGKSILTMILMLILVIIASVIILLSGCDLSNLEKTNVAQADTEYSFSFLEKHPYFTIYLDEKTGVEYLVYRSGGNYSVTPRYNSDGTLYIYGE